MILIVQTYPTFAAFVFGSVDAAYVLWTQRAWGRLARGVGTHLLPSKQKHRSQK